jgi:hypothetical protein
MLEPWHRVSRRGSPLEARRKSASARDVGLRDAWSQGRAEVTIGGTPQHGTRHSELQVAIYLATYRRVLSVEPQPSAIATTAVA